MCVRNTRDLAGREACVVQVRRERRKTETGGGLNEISRLSRQGPGRGGQVSLGQRPRGPGTGPLVVREEVKVSRFAGTPRLLGNSKRVDCGERCRGVAKKAK